MIDYVLVLYRRCYVVARVIYCWCCCSPTAVFGISAFACPRKSLEAIRSLRSLFSSRRGGRKKSPSARAIEREIERKSARMDARFETFRARYSWGLVIRLSLTPATRNGALSSKIFYALDVHPVHGKILPAVQPLTGSGMVGGFRQLVLGGLYLEAF